MILNFTIFDWITFLTLPSLIIGYALMKVRRENSLLEYYFAKGQLPTGQAAQTNFGANLAFASAFVVFSSQAATRGFWTLSVPIGWAIGTILLWRLYPRVSALLGEHTTLHEALGKITHSNHVRFWAGIWTIVAFVGTIALEFYGAVKVMQWAGLPNTIAYPATFGIAFATTIFTSRGGFRRIAKVAWMLNAVSLFSIFALLYLLLATPLLHLPTGQQVEHLLRPSPLTGDNVIFSIGMLLVFIPFQLCAFDAWQRIRATAQTATTPRWLLASGIALAFVFLIPIFIGMDATADEGQPIRGFLSIHQALLPVGCMGLVLAGFITAVISTADELLNCCSLTMLADVLQHRYFRVVKERELPESIQATGKFYTGVFATVAAILAIICAKYESGVTQFAVAVFSGQIVLLPWIYVILFKPNRAREMQAGVKAALLLSYIAIGLSLVVGWLWDSKWADAAPLLGLVVSSAVFLFELVRAHVAPRKS